MSQDSEIYKTIVAAFYLPQFYPTPENDKFWGKGFTEWRNVALAKPLFKGHRQPRVPADLGFYDLRVPETIYQQASLAKQYSIDAFCFWHYWFGDGRITLEKPINILLKEKEIDINFFVAWANGSWTSQWIGKDNQVIIKQKYGDEADTINHYKYLSSFFEDPRYLLFNKSPVLVILEPRNIPNFKSLLKQLNQLARSDGYNGLYCISPKIHTTPEIELLLNATCGWPPGDTVRKIKNYSYVKNIRVRNFYLDKVGLPRISDYSDFVTEQSKLYTRANTNLYFPTVLPNWDNWPRYGKANQGKAIILINDQAKFFKAHTRNALEYIKTFNSEHSILFIKAWNEWAEGNYLEPDLDDGLSRLKALKEAIIEFS